VKRTPLIRRTRLRRRSLKTQRAYVARRQLVERLLTERPQCEVPWCSARSVDIHEPLTRARGGSILDEDNCRAVCRMHHDLIHANAEAWVEDLGFLRHSWDGR
jgi:hypothetical protein